MCLTSLVLSLQEIIANLLLEDNDLLSYVYTLDPNLKMNVYACWVIVTFKDLNHFFGQTSHLINLDLKGCNLFLDPGCTNELHGP
jgi:hypothetical protein